MSEEKLDLQSFPTPYPVDLDNKRISVDLSPTDHYFLSTLCPDRGFKNRIGQLFYADFIAELRTLNIEYYSPANEQLVFERLAKRLTSFKPTHRSDGEVESSGTEGAGG